LPGKISGHDKADFLPISQNGGYKLSLFSQDNGDVGNPFRTWNAEQQ
jgi:hypothetical protein